MKRSLFEEYIAGEEQVWKFFPLRLDEWEKAIRGRREKLAEAWRAEELWQLGGYNRKIGAGEKTLENIEHLGEAETLVVATGQQPGVLGGPLYNIYKALTALRLAEELAMRFHIKILPLFWLASDDHDIEEAGHFYWLNKEGGVEEFIYQPKGYVPARPLFLTPVDKEQFEELFRRLRITNFATEFIEGLLSVLRRIVSESASFEEQFARILCWLLGNSGIIFVPPYLPAIRRRSLAIIKKEIETAGESSNLIREGAKEIERLHYKPQLYRHGGQVNFFLLDESQRRCRIDYMNFRFEIRIAEEDKITNTLVKEELLSLIMSQPEKISLNVVSRPLVQDFIFSTIAYVAGPGEISYFAQLRPVYEFFSVFMPIIFPRVHLLIIEPRIARLLDKYNLSAENIFELATDEFELSQRIKEGLTEMPLASVIEETHSEIRNSLQQLEQALQSLSDTAVKDSLAKLRQHIVLGFSHLEERYKKAILLKKKLLSQHQEKMQSALIPRGKPQERVFSPLFPYMQNFGREFLELVKSSLDPFVFKKEIKLKEAQTTNGCKSSHLNDSL